MTMNETNVQKNKYAVLLGLKNGIKMFILTCTKNMIFRINNLEKVS